MKHRKIFFGFNRIHYVICFAATIALFVSAILFIKDTGKARFYELDFSAISNDTADDGSAHLFVHGISLRKGNYNLAIGYVSDIASSITISLDNDSFRSEELAPAPGGNTVSYNFELKSGTDRGRIDLNCPAGGDLQLVSVVISSDKPLNYDRLIIGILMILMIPCIWLGMFLFIRSDHKIPIAATILIVIIQILPFLINTGLHLGVDTRGQMMRIEGIYYGLLDGQFPVIIYPEWNNSYGQIGTLYPNMFLYIPAVFRLLGMSQLGACKLFLFLVIVSGAAIALVSAMTVFRRDWQMTLAVMIICLDNMRLLDMLGDGRIGGALLAEMFYPLVIAGLIEVFYRNKYKWYLLAIGVAGIFCCHVMSATIICLAIAVYTLFSLEKLRDPGILGSIFKSVLLFFGLTFGTAVLFLKFYFSDWGQDKLQWKDFISTLWPRGRFYDDIIWTYSFVLILICIASIVVIVYRKQYELIKDTYIIPCLACASIFTWMSTRAFPWVLLNRIPVIKYYTDMVQDTYRFVSISVCFLAFCVAGLLEAVVVSVEGRRSFESRTTTVSWVIIVLICGVSYLLLFGDFFVMNKKVLYYDSVIGAIETQVEDYLPSGTQSEWYVSDAGTVSDEDAVKSLAYEREGTYVHYSYTNSQEGAYVEFPRFFYDGYVAENEMAEAVPVYKGDRNRTRVYLEVTDTPAEIRMWYHVPRHLTLAVSLSFGLWMITIIVLGAGLIYRIESDKKQEIRVFVKKNTSVIYISLFTVTVVLMSVSLIDRSPQGVVINEICTSNVTNCEDVNGSFPDWVELYNPTEWIIDLSGYVFYKTSDPRNDRYKIPSGTRIEAGSYYLFDPGFKMPASGCDLTLVDPKDRKIDRVYVPKLKFDTTYARQSDGASEWNTKVPSPGWSNADEADLYPTVEGTVYASVPSGFYDDGIDLELGSSDPGRQIYYTVDGTDPVKHGILYDKPLHIRDRSEDDNVYSIIPDVSEMYTSGQTRVPSFPVDKCTVVSAVAKDDLGRYTDVSTFFYFVGFNEKKAYDNVPVVSVMADPDDLFSYEDGIMVLGRDYDRYVEAGSPEDGYDDYKANYMHKGRRSERPIDLAIFDEGHRSVLETKACIRLKGLSTRVDEQKSFNICFHSAVGGNYKEDFTVDNTDYSVHAFSLDKGGQDIETKMKDTIMEYCMYDSDCATTHRTPCCLFINGEYWGFYWMAERFDRSYLADRYEVDKESVVIKDSSDYESYSDWPVEEFDRNSLIEYYASNIIVAHEEDWPHMNFSFWHTDVVGEGRYGDGMYRPVIFDMNSTSMEDPSFDSFTYLTESFAIFSNRLKSDEAFREDIVSKINDMEKDEFEKGKILGLIDDIYGRVHDQMVLDRMRYFDSSKAEAEAGFDKSVQNLRDFYINRYDNLETQKEAFLNAK